jgi:hypothetical protein
MYDKALKMWLDTLEWRKEYEVDNILDNFVFHEREQFLMAYPQGYHKTDKLVCSRWQLAHTILQQPAPPAGQQHIEAAGGSICGTGQAATFTWLLIQLLAVFVEADSCRHNCSSRWYAGSCSCSSCSRLSQTSRVSCY